MDTPFGARELLWTLHGHFSLRKSPKVVPNCLKLSPATAV